MSDPAVRGLVLFAHPAPHKSPVNRVLVAAARDTEGVTVRELYEEYPDQDVVIEQEQDLLLEHGWACGSRGTRLRMRIDALRLRASASGRSRS